MRELIDAGLPAQAVANAFAGEARQFEKDREPFLLYD